MAHVPATLSQGISRRASSGSSRKAASSGGRQAPPHITVCVAKRAAKQRDCSERIARGDEEAPVKHRARRGGGGTDSKGEKALRQFAPHYNSPVMSSSADDSKLQ